MIKDYSATHCRIHFQLEIDEDGYPPASVETVWAIKTSDNLFEIDNIPFYIRGIAVGDTVSVRMEDHNHWFDKVLYTANHSTVRVVILNHKSETSQACRTELEKLGCSWEGMHEFFFAVDVPREVPLSPIIDFLRQGADQGIWDYEEGCLSRGHTSSG